MSSIGSDDERDLKARFAEMRRQEASEAPKFAALIRRGATRRRPFRHGKLAIAAACVLVIAFLLARFRPRPAAAPVPSLTEWKSPTDFLLQTPGRDLLYSVPQFDAWPEGAGVADPRPSPTARKTI